jgi:RNA polymerase sigma-70 factor (ECF subfamily)
VAQTARNLAIAEYRKQGRRKTETGNDSIEEVADTSQAQDKDVERESSAAAIRAVLDEMPNRRDRQLLVRYYLHDEEKRAICEDLAMSEASFNVVMFRARSRFLELLQKRGLRAADLMSLVLL